MSAHLKQFLFFSGEDENQEANLEEEKPRNSWNRGRKKTENRLQKRTSESSRSETNEIGGQRT